MTDIQTSNTDIMTVHPANAEAIRAVMDGVPGVSVEYVKSPIDNLRDAMGPGNENGRHTREERNNGRQAAINKNVIIAVTEQTQS